MSQLAILLIIGLIACICFAIGYLYAHRTSDNVEYYWGEKGYLNLIQKIVTSGVDRDDRTGTGTRALFGEVLKFDLALGFPLLTTKFVSFKTILTELLWFLKGTDNIDYLRSKGVKIWDDNTSREFLDNRGLTHYSVGQLGPGYGKLSRFFGNTSH